MKIDTNTTISGTENLTKTRQQKNDSVSFGEVVERAFSSVNDKILKAEEGVEQMAAGKPVDIAQTMTAVTEADISFRMAMQVRNKVLSAYEEIMRMQV